MKKTILLLLFTIQVYSQVYELKYKCEIEFNSQKYDLIQQFNEKRYSYKVEKTLEETMNSNESKVSLSICLNSAMNSESINSDKKEYFFTELDYYQNILNDKNYNPSVEFISNNQTKEVIIDIDGTRTKQIITEYILQNTITKKALYKVWFLENFTFNHGMPYNKKQLMSDWTTLFYAFKNSKMKKLIYSVEQIGQNIAGVRDTNIFQCKLLYVKKINDFVCKE